MLSGLPKVALDRLPGAMPTHDFPMASGEKGSWHGQLLLVGDPRAGLITKSP